VYSASGVARSENALQVADGGLHYWGRTFEVWGIEAQDWPLLLAGPLVMAVEPPTPPSFTKKPVAAKAGDKVKIDFAVDRETDVAVYVEDAAYLARKDSSVLYKMCYAGMADQGSQIFLDHSANQAFAPGENVILWANTVLATDRQAVIDRVGSRCTRYEGAPCVCQVDDATIVKTWNEVISILETDYPKEAKVAVIQDGTMQYMRPQ
jgi:hypothetical protein